MESLVGNCLDVVDEVYLNNHNISSLTPELSFSPLLGKLFLQENHNLTMLPPSFFQHIPFLQVLDLSHTSIQSLPPSLFKLHLLEEFILRECSLLIELPPEIGALQNLKLFDLEGTEIMYLPKEIGKLKTLERLRVSLSTYADDHKDRNGIEHIIPRTTISKLTRLKELSISVNPEGEWWEVELLEAIMGDLRLLPDLKTLKLYLPTAKALQHFLRLERNQIPVYSSLWNYRFMIGQCEQLPFSVQLDIEENFMKLEKCVKYMNGEGYTNEILELIRNARALYLRRHWTIEKLSIFDIRSLKYCLLMECNEMQTLVDHEDLHKHKNKSTSHGEEILGSLQYLSIHFMKKLQRISNGPIGRNSLSCLRILALHTCPEMTSIFMGCFVENMQSLTELIVEDCPKVNCLVNLEEGTPWSTSSFLQSLRRVSLLDLPELVSISGGVCIAPQLDTLLVFNCMKLDYLSVMELPKGTKAIKGEIEWWDALKYGKLTWHNVFVQLKRDGGLMDRLAEDTNSLQHFLDLKRVPSYNGSNQNSTRDTKEGGKHVDQIQIVHNVVSSNETRKMSTEKILIFNHGRRFQYAGTAFSKWEPPCAVSDKPHNEDTHFDFKASNHQLATTKKKSSSADIAKWIQLVKRNSQISNKVLQVETLNSKNPRKNRRISIITSKFRVKVNKGMKVEKAFDDGYIWRKYSQKILLGSKYPRAYYRCCFGRTHGCSARKHVQRYDEDPSVFEVSYMGKHTCSTIILSNNCSSTVTESDSIITDSHFELAKRPQVLVSNKKNSSSARDTKWTQQVKVISKTGFDIPPDDGYVWRKYVQRRIFKAKSSKSYYKCTNCDAQKKVQRSDNDPSIWLITYIGKHSCLRVSVTNNPASETESATSILKNRNSSTATESELRILKNSSSSTTAESASTITDNSSGLDFTNKKSDGAIIQGWKQQMNETQWSFSPSLNLQLASSSITSEPSMITSEVVENSSKNLPLSTKTPQNPNQCYSPVSKARKGISSDKLIKLHQLVSPFEKWDATWDTIFVLTKTHGYINFLHEQITALMAAYTKQRSLVPQQQIPKQDLRSQGLCLVPVSSTHPVTNQINVDFSSPALGQPLDEPKV